MATTVADLYRQTLGREPDPGGLEYWTQMFGSSIDPTEAATFASVAQNELAARPAAAAPANPYNNWYTPGQGLQEGRFGAGPMGEQVGDTPEAKANFQERLFWEQYAPQLFGYTGPIGGETQGDQDFGPAPQTYSTDFGSGYSKQFVDFVNGLKNQGYEFVINNTSRNRQKFGLQDATGNLVAETPEFGQSTLEQFTGETLPLLATIGGLAYGGNALANMFGGGAGAAGAGAGLADYSLATAPGAANLTGTGAGLSVGAPAAESLYSLGGMPVYGAGAGLAPGVAPLVGTGAGLALNPLAAGSPTLGAPTSFINQPPATPSVPGAAGAAGAAGSALSNLPKLPGLPGMTGGSMPDWLAPFLGGLASITGGAATAEAQKEAARLQAQSAENALALQRRMYEESVERAKPYYDVGVNALGQLARGEVQMEPGYGFRLGEGMKALERVQAARGGLLSGGAIKAGQRYAQDYATGEYGNAYNRLANLAGVGQTTSQNLANLGQNYATSAGNLGMEGANALAAGRLGRASSYAGGLAGAGQAFMDYSRQQQENALLNQYINRRFPG